MNLVIVRHNFVPIPFVRRLNNHAVDASPDDGCALKRPPNDYYIDRFVALRDFVVDELAELGVGFELVDVANVLVAALTFAEFVDLSHNIFMVDYSINN